MNEPKKSKLAELVDGMGSSGGRRPSAEEIDRVATLPRRDGAPEDEGFMQVNLKLRVSIAKRFKAAASDHGGQAKILEEMLDRWESGR